MDELTVTLNEPVEPEEHRSARWMRAVAGTLLAACGLAWVLHDFHLADLRNLVVGISPGWIALAIIFDILSYVCQGMRWRLLLRPLGNISTLRATQAIYAGLFSSEVLPMRVGEVLRGYLVSRWMAARFVTVVPSMVVERFIDGVWLTMSIGVTAMFLPLPRDLIRTTWVLAVGLMVVALVACYFVARASRGSIAGWLPHRVHTLLELLARGLKEIYSARDFILAVATSMFVLLFQMIAFWLVMIGCGLHLSIWSGLTVFLIERLGTAVPNAPGNIGSYQFFTVIGLTLLGVDKTAATAFSLVAFVLLTLPLLLLGFAALSLSGMNMRTLRREMRSVAH